MGFNNVVPGFILREWAKEEKEMSEERDWTYRGGGLFRCCTGTIREHDAPGTTEGELLDCKHCSGKMRWDAAGRLWESSEAPRWRALQKERAQVNGTFTNG